MNTTHNYDTPQKKAPWQGHIAECLALLMIAITGVAIWTLIEFKSVVMQSNSLIGDVRVAMQQNARISEFLLAKIEGREIVLPQPQRFLNQEGQPEVIDSITPAEGE